MIPFVSMEKVKFPSVPGPLFVVMEVMLAAPETNVMVP